MHSEVALKCAAAANCTQRCLTTGATGLCSSCNEQCGFYLTRSDYNSSAGVWQGNCTSFEFAETGQADFKFTAKPQPQKCNQICYHHPFGARVELGEGADFGSQKQPETKLAAGPLPPDPKAAPGQYACTSVCTRELDIPPPQTSPDHTKILCDVFQAKELTFLGVGKGQGGPEELELGEGADHVLGLDLGEEDKDAAGAGRRAATKNSQQFKLQCNRVCKKDTDYTNAMSVASNCDSNMCLELEHHCANATMESPAPTTTAGPPPPPECGTRSTKIPPAKFGRENPCGHFDGDQTNCQQSYVQGPNGIFLKCGYNIRSKNCLVRGPCPK